MNIGLTYNVRHAKPDINNPQYVDEAEFDEPATILGIEATLNELGHRVFRVEADENAYEALRTLRSSLDIVFNIAEGIRGRDREAHIPAILEMLGIPYTGPSPLGYALALNKAKAKEIFLHNNIATPRFMVISSPKQLNEPFGLTFPVIAKPNGEGSSKGIQAHNFVRDIDEMKSITTILLDEFKQDVLIEEYLTGREFTVGVIGNPLRVLPIIEVHFDELPNDMPKFDHFEAKWLYDNPASHKDPLTCPASIPLDFQREIEMCSLKACASLRIMDWARLDIRLDAKGIPNIIEINCPPGIIPDPKENSRFPRAARTGGLEYPQMLEEILKSACDRYDLTYAVPIKNKVPIN